MPTTLSQTFEAISPVYTMEEDVWKRGYCSEDYISLFPNPEKTQGSEGTGEFVSMSWYFSYN